MGEIEALKWAGFGQRITARGTLDLAISELLSMEEVLDNVAEANKSCEGTFHMF